MNTRLCFVILLLASVTAQAVSVKKVVGHSGVMAWLVEDHSVPVTSISFAFLGSGTSLDKAGKEGRTSLMASLLTEGAGSLKSEAFRRALDDRSITLSYGAGRDHLYGTLYTLNTYRKKAVELAHLSLSQPRFDKDAVERVRRQTLTGLQKDQTQPGFLARKALWKALFPQSSYGLPEEGTLDSVKKLTPSDMHEAFKGIQTSRLIVGVAGDITPKETRDLLDSLFGGLPQGTPSPSYTLRPHLPHPKKIKATLDVPQTVILFAQEGVARHDPDFYPAYILNQIAGGGLSSRLSMEIRSKLGLAYGVGSSLLPFAHTSLWVGQVATRHAQAQKTLDTLKVLWARLRDHGVTAQEVKDAQDYLVDSFPLNFTNTSSISDFLRSMQEQHLKRTYISQRNHILRSVTPSMVNRVAQKRLKPEGLVFSVVGR